jgi:RNA polymerase sigma-70 factor, ECF subfamily
MRRGVRPPAPSESRRGKPFLAAGALYESVDVVTIESADPSRAMDELFRRESPRLWRALMAFTAGRADVADEAVSEAFARAVANGDRVEQPVAWLYRVAFRIAAQELRRERDRATPESPSIAEETAEQDEFGELFSALVKLPANQRAAVFLHYRCDLSVREVADRLGVSTATARVHLWRGRQRLRRLLEGSGDE